MNIRQLRKDTSLYFERFNEQHEDKEKVEDLLIKANQLLIEYLSITDRDDDVTYIKHADNDKL
jgi:hypothetical protein